MKKVNSIIIGSICIAVVVIIADAQFSQGQQRKNGVLQQAFTNLLQAETYHTRIELVFKTPSSVVDGKQRSEVGISTSIEGDVKWNSNSPTFIGRMYAEAKGRGMTLFSDGEIRIFEDDMAFRLDNLPVLLNPSGNLIDKWSYVEKPLLQTKNITDVRTAITDTFKDMTYIKKEENMYHFQQQITAEQEDKLQYTLHQDQSGNQGLHVIARLLDAFDVKSLDVLVDDKTKQVAIIQMNLMENKEEEENNDRNVTLTILFSEYGKDVTLERPEREAAISSKVFSKLFNIPNLIPPA